MRSFWLFSIWSMIICHKSRLGYKAHGLNKVASSIPALRITLHQMLANSWLDNLTIWPETEYESKCHLEYFLDCIEEKNMGKSPNSCECSGITSYGKNTVFYLQYLQMTLQVTMTQKLLKSFFFQFFLVPFFHIKSNDHDWVFLFGIDSTSE